MASPRNHREPDGAFKLFLGQTTTRPMERKDETRVKGFDLPPGAGRGTDDKGHVTLTVDGLEWQLRGAPPWVRVTARWWGDELSDKRQRPWAKLVDGPGGSASMTFPVKAKPAGFSRYCRDARAVVLEVRPRCARRPETRRGSRFDSKSAPKSHPSFHPSFHPSIHPSIPHRRARPLTAHPSPPNLPLRSFAVFRRAHREAHRQRQRRRLAPRRPPPSRAARGGPRHQSRRRLGHGPRGVRAGLRHRRGVIVRAQRAPQQDGRYPPLGAPAVDASDDGGEKAGGGRRRQTKGRGRAGV